MSAALPNPRAPLSTELDLAGWPGAARREPSRSQRDYLTLSSLAAGVRDQVDAQFPARTDLRVLDVGCGEKPYLPLVAHRAASYTGFDAGPGPYVDDVGSADALPYPEGSFDLVLCTQVFEHLEQPHRAVREIHRVLSPGGLALVSTHGVHVYHPSPGDYFRWTHAGLELLFHTNASWQSLQVGSNRNAVACLATLICWYVDLALERLGVPWLRRAVITALNAIAEPLDSRYPPTLRVPAPGSLAANYLVTATR